MRHKVQKHRLNLPRDQKRLLLKNLATSLILHEKIQTTQARAQALQPMVEKLVREAKNPNKVLAIRNVGASLQSQVAAKKLLENLSKKFQNKQSGFTRITKVGFRSGDAAPLVEIELTV